MSTIQTIISRFLAFLAIAASFLRPNTSTSVQTAVQNLSNPLSIESMRVREYQGSDITIEQTLSSEKTYKRYIVSYKSDGLKIYALLLVPSGPKPDAGFPVIIFNHGYIIPQRYTPDGNYIAYTDALASAGYIVFKPNYRGNGNSEGDPTGAYFSPDYVIDDLNAIASIKKYPLANPAKIGVWGHSMGGNITLKDVVINRTDIKAAVIWGGVVAPINDIIYNWQNRVSYRPDTLDLRLRTQNRDLILKTYGTPSENPAFWNSVDPNSFLGDISAPIQIDVGLSDNQVPPDFSTGLYDRLQSVGKVVEYFEYPGSNHDINQSFSLAMKNTIDFFDRYLK
jgi:dipeptidyl aminopeptidase/acylaminoacyl peptidase